MIVVMIAAVSAVIACAHFLVRHLDAAAVLDEGADDARLEQVAAVGDRAHRRHHLQRRHADLVAHRDRRQRAVVQPRRIPDDAGGLAAEIGSERLPEAEAA